LLLLSHFFFLILRRPLLSTLFPYTTLFRSPAVCRSAYRAWFLRRLRQDHSANRRRHTLVSKTRGSNSPGDFCFGLSAQEARNERSEEHTSELQSRFDLVCRLLLEKKNKKNK